MGASANLLDKDCSSYDSNTSYCRRTKFGISVGAIGTSFALIVVAMKMLTSVAPMVVESVLALFLCIMNGFVSTDYSISNYCYLRLSIN